jgi:hypothetical protein
MQLLSIGNNSATGFVAADHTKKKIVLSMRGSVSLSNWIADIKFFQMDCPQFGGKGSACSIGFLGFWEQSKPQAMKGLLEGLKENPTYDIVVTGHSLGAAAGVYAAGELRKTYKNVELVQYFSFHYRRLQTYAKHLSIRMGNHELEMSKCQNSSPTKVTITELPTLAMLSQSFRQREDRSVPYPGSINTSRLSTGSRMA